MRISLDYDGTYTQDPELWNTFIASAESRGHEVICVTMRYESEPVPDGMPCAVLYTGRESKRSFTDRIGKEIDVWIDDMPMWISRNG